MVTTYLCPKCKKYWRNVGHQVDDSVERDNRYYEVVFVNYRGDKAIAKRCFKCTPEPAIVSTNKNNPIVGRLNRIIENVFSLSTPAKK